MLGKERRWSRVRSFAGIVGERYAREIIRCTRLVANMALIRLRRMLPTLAI
jgi:hypothetical protein